MQEERRILLVTGAGASRNLGRDNPLPLMGEWAGILRDEINVRHGGLAEHFGLAEDISAEQFEEAVGAVLSLSGATPVIDRFLNMGGDPPGSINSQVQQWRGNISDRLEIFTDVLRSTLYREFGRDVIDDGKARRAIGGLIQDLGDAALVFATTNYDQSIEIGLDQNDIRVRDGFAEGSWSSPALDPAGTVSWPDVRPGEVPVLHLHGAVGWYAKPNGRIVRQFGDEPYNPTLGVPAILPPDPAKEPMSAGYVQGIWGEFERATKNSTHIVVLGHSLHDTPVVEMLVQNGRGARIALTYHEEPHNVAELQRSYPGGAALDKAVQFRVDFGAQPSLGEEFRQWLSE